MRSSFIRPIGRGPKLYVLRLVPDGALNIPYVAANRQDIVVMREMVNRHICVVSAQLASVDAWFIVTSCSHRQANLGPHEKRIGRSPTGRSTALGRRSHRIHLSAPTTPTFLVHQMVESLCARWAEGLYELSLAPHTLIDRLPPQIERLIVSVRRRWEAHLTPRDPLSTHWCPNHPDRVESLAGRTPAQPAHHRTGALAAWLDQSTAAHRTTTPPNGYPTPIADDSNALSKDSLKTARGRSGGTDLSDRTPSALIHLPSRHLPRCVRWRPLPTITAFPPHGRGRGVSDRRVAIPRSARAGAIRQRPRILLLSGDEGWSQSARYLSRVIRLCLHLRVTPLFIPTHRPQRNGASLP
jgi:hypothetical protein